MAAVNRRLLTFCFGWTVNVGLGVFFGAKTLGGMS